MNRPIYAHLQLLPVLLSHRKHIGDIVCKAEIPQCLLDVLACDGLLGFLFADVVCLGRDQSDELDTTFHEQIARILGEGLAHARGEDFGDDLLDRRYSQTVLASSDQTRGTVSVAAANEGFSLRVQRDSNIGARLK